MEATGMFRSTVDSNDIRRIHTELDRSLLKLLPICGIRQNAMEAGRKHEKERKK